MDIPSYSIVALFLLVLATGCSVLPGATSTRTTATTTTQTVSADSATAPTPESANTEPTKIAIFQDQSSSIDKTRTPRLKTEDLTPLFGLLLQGGGELALGPICDRSNRSLIRVRIEQPPVPPAKPHEYSAEGNPFAAAEKRNEYESKAVAHQKALADYNQRQQQWRNQSEQQLKQFKAAIAPILNQPANCQATDIWGAVQRADLFLNESDTTWSRPVKAVAIFISDGIDNLQQTPAVAMKSNAKIIVVNGSASLGSFSNLNPMRFESPTAAFRHVVSSRGK